MAQLKMIRLTCTNTFVETDEVCGWEGETEVELFEDGVWVAECPVCIEMYEYDRNYFNSDD